MDVHRIDLPGLVGDEPLGFLAAIGLRGQVDGYLSWDPTDRHAILHSQELSSVADVEAVLVKRLASVKDEQAIPHTSNWPVPRRRGAPDPLRVRPDAFRHMYKRISNNGGGRSWLTATLTDQVTDANGYCRLNPLIAVRGRQTIGSFWYYPMLEVRRNPQRLLTEALTRWRRVEGSDAWLLDHHATYSMDPALRGPGGSMGVPGATWLATLAVRVFPWDVPEVNVVSWGERPGYSSDVPDLPRGWFRVDGQEVFLWPLWTMPISGGTTFDVVWNSGWKNGEWELSSAVGGTLRACIPTTHGVMPPNGIHATADLGIFTMCAAARSSTGVLAPMPVRISRTPNRWGEAETWRGWDWEYPEFDGVY